MAPSELQKRPPTWAGRGLPSLRARFYVLLAALAVLALAPWLVTEELRRGTDGFAIAIQETGSLRFRLLQILVQVPQARSDGPARERVETLMREQSELLDHSMTGNPATGFAACPAPDVCARFTAHRSRWTDELRPRLQAALDGSDTALDALTTDVLLEVTELDLTVRAAARVVQDRMERNARLGSWASMGSVLLVALVALGVGQIFTRIRRLRSLVDASDDRTIREQVRGTDELDALARALGTGIAAEREQREAEARRAEELAVQQLAVGGVAESLSSWLAGSGSLDRSLREVARATGHERAELAGDPATLRLRGKAADREGADDVLIDTLSQIFAIACLADRLLADKAVQGRLAVALGGLSGRPDEKEIEESLSKLIAHDAAVIELYDANRRVEDMWAMQGGRLERLPALCDGSAPEHVTLVPPDSNAGCAVLRQRCGGAQLVIPLRMNQDLTGAIYLARGVGEFSDHDLRNAQALAPVAASALARVQLEARLRFAEQWSTLGAFGRLLAHEIKNPLNSLGLELNLLERRVAKLELPSADREKLTSSVGVVKSELARLTKLTNEYLSMSPKSGALEVQPVDLSEIAASVARTHAASMADRAIRLEEHLPGPAMVLGHPDKLKQLVHNLLGNAIEAMVGSSVRVATLAIRRHGAEYELAVRDTGPGISDPVAIFTPGFTTKASGTGMGLAISQQIARQHGGRLVARAIETGGAEFTLSIAAHDSGAPN